MKLNRGVSRPGSPGSGGFHKQAGLTLLELMISLGLGLILLTGIGTIYIGSNQTYRVQEQNARIQESGRYAIDLIGRSVRQAGYWNMSNQLDDDAVGFVGTPVAGTATTLTVQYDGSGGRNCSNAVVAAGTVVTDAFDRNSANLRLRCNASPLVDNVEDLQFLYGLDTNSDDSADQYVTAPTVAQQPQIVSVRVCVLIRSEDQGIASAAQRYLNCAGALGTAATAAAEFTSAASSDNQRLHRVFVATFNLRNRVP
jgi:type IV pilus assembly protein PilW